MNIQTVLSWLDPTYLAKQAQRAATNFPMTVLSSWMVAIQLIMAVHANEEPNEFYTTLGLLGISGFIAAELAAKAWRLWSLTWLNRIFFNALMACILLCAVYPMWSHDLTEFYIIRYLAFGAALHGLVSFIPHISKGKKDIRFWSYNAKMFVAAISSGILAWFLMAGILMILGALDLLFEVEINNLYPDSMAIVGFPILTVIFLARMPKGVDEETLAITEFIRRLLAFIIWPLLIIYGVILWAYLFKIMIEGVMPKGVVWGLVGGFSAILLLASSLSWQNDKLRNLATWTIRLAVPLLALQWIAIHMRIDQYGFTVHRTVAVYYSLLSSLLLLYFAIRKQPKWLVVPVLGSTMALSLAYGPLSAEAVGFRSQMQRFLDLAAEKEVMNDEGRWFPMELNAIDDASVSALKHQLHYISQTPERIMSEEKLAFLHDHGKDIEEVDANTFLIHLGFDDHNKWGETQSDVEYFTGHYNSGSNWHSVEDHSKVIWIEGQHLTADDLEIGHGFKMSLSDFEELLAITLNESEGKSIKLPIHSKREQGQIVIFSCTTLGTVNDYTVRISGGLIVIPSTSKGN